MLNDTLLFIHLLGLMMGAGGGFGSMIVMRRALALPPEQAGPLRSVGPALARFSLIGLILMWLTGLALVFSKYDGLTALPSLFWVKIVFVLSLTIAAVTIELTYAQIKSGNMASAARLPVLGPIAGMSSLLAVLFAVFAFH
jgi:hypothetical protein